MLFLTANGLFSTLNRKKHKLFLTYCGLLFSWSCFLSTHICCSSSTILIEGRCELFVETDSNTVDIYTCGLGSDVGRSSDPVRLYPASTVRRLLDSLVCGQALRESGIRRRCRLCEEEAHESQSLPGTWLACVIGRTDDTEKKFDGHG